MKKFTFEFYSNQGFLLGETVKECNDLSEAEQSLKKLLENNGIVITSKDKLGNTKKDFIRSNHVAKVSLTEQN